MDAEHKQVLVLRKDLNMRKGKMAAQASHASMGSALPREQAIIETQPNGKVRLSWEIDAEQLPWFLDLSKKVVVGANNEAQILDIFRQAQQQGLPCVLIRDRGLTEFGGVPTLTGVGIGPAPADKIDPITGNLPLL
jgi:peptidyl-tRNA hydrolase, PTH2 family